MSRIILILQRILQIVLDIDIKINLYIYGHISK